MSTLTCGETVGECLKEEGVSHVFGLPGHGNIGILDGIFKAGIRFVMCHDETICGHAADGYFRASGKPGVVCLTCSPGAFNAMLAVTTSAMDCSAVVYLVGDIPIKFAGRTAYEEFDLHGSDDEYATLRPMFKRAWKVTRLDAVPDALANAFNVARTGKPGPVLVDIPFDLHKERETVEIPRMGKRRPAYQPAPDPAAVEEAADLLGKATAPVIYAGGGAKLSRATKELVELSERLRAPVVTSLVGAGVFPTNHPNWAGVIGSYGHAHANKLCNEADVVLAVGTRFEESETSMWLPEYVFRVPPTKVIQVDVDPREIGKNYEVEVGIVADAKLALRALLQAVEPAEEILRQRAVRLDGLWREKSSWMQRIAPAMEAGEIPLSPRRVLKELESLLPEHATLTVDPSWCRIGMLQQFEIKDSDEVHVVGGVLPIGWSAAACIGVQVARPDRKVVSLGGDGGFLLRNNAVATAVEYDLPIVWVILNNYGYNALAVLQRNYFGKTEGSFFVKARTGEDYSPDYAQLAEAFGAKGERVTRPEDIRPAIERALSAGQPYVLDFVVSRTGSRLVRTAQVTWEYFWERAR